MRRQNFYVIAFVIILCALPNTAAMAAVKSKHVTFNEDLTVGGTVVKKGDYKVTFDDQTRQLLISSGRRVVARAAASLEEPGAKEHFVYTARQGDGGQPESLVSVNMGGELAVISLDNPAGTDAQPTTP